MKRLLLLAVALLAAGWFSVQSSAYAITDAGATAGRPESHAVATTAEAAGASGAPTATGAVVATGGSSTEPTTSITVAPASGEPASPVETSGKPLAKAAALAALVKLLLELLRRRTPLLKGHEQRKALVISMVLGAVAFGLDSLVLGTPWFDAVIGSGGALGGLLLDIVFPTPVPAVVASPKP